MKNMAVEKSPRVSIITTSLNYGKFIEKTILSVKNQDYSNLEHIVMDGASTDNTLEILRKYNQTLVWRSEPDNGLYDGYNRGFKLSTGEIIGWLNADDIYQPGAIRYAADYLERHPEVVMIYGECDSIDDDDRIISREPIADFDMALLRDDACLVAQATTFIRRRVFQQVGLYDSSLKYSADLEFFLRIGLNYEKSQIHRLPIVLANFRRHTGQKTGYKSSFKSFWACEIETLRLSRKYGGSIFNKRHRLFPKSLAFRVLKPTAQKLGIR